MTDTQEEHLVDALCVQLCSVVRSEGRYGSARPYPPKRGIPPNAIAVSVLNEGYSKAFHNTVLPDVVRGLGLAKTSVLLRDKRMAGCVSVQTDESNNQLMVWPAARAPALATFRSGSRRTRTRRGPSCGGRSTLAAPRGTQTATKRDWRTSQAGAPGCRRRLAPPSA
jgi:hypothetical protein